MEKLKEVPNFRTLRFFIYSWVNHWLEIVDGILGVLSFTLIHPSFAFKHCLRYSKKEMMRKIKEEM